MKEVVTRELLESLVLGKWYIEPKDDWTIGHITENVNNCRGSQTLFIAMDKENWLKGSGNVSKVYSQWDDTHEKIINYSEKINGVICQRPIKQLPKHIPQYIVEDPYDLINKLFDYVRPKISSKIISITGTVGKSTTKEILKKCLNEFGETYATEGNHNSRTGMKLTVCNSIHNPNYIVMETAVASLWMRNGGMNIITKPDYAIITEVGTGQNGTDANKMAEYKSRVANGLSKDGVLIINRDINNFDLLLGYCEKYTKNIFTYGRHKDSDLRMKSNGSEISIEINENIYNIRTSVLDYGAQSNILAVIATLYVLDLDFMKCANIFKEFKQRKSVLEKHLFKEKNITVIDDTYNAEELSMTNAINFCGKEYKDKRKIAIISDVINLEKMSESVHEGFANLLIKNNFSGVATYGEESKVTNQNIPYVMNIGHFKDGEQCIENVARFLNKDDVVLIKGDRRNSIIHYFPEQLIKKLGNLNSVDNLTEYAQKFNLNDKMENSFKNENLEYGLGGLILLFLSLQNYLKGNFRLDSTYEVSEFIAREGKHNNALGLKYKEKITYIQLIQLTYLTQKADVILALAEFVFGNTSNAQIEIEKYAQLNNIDKKAVLNITGRNFRNEKQSFLVSELLIVSNNIFSLPQRALDLLSTKLVDFNGKVYEFPIIGWRDEYVDYLLFIGDTQRRTYISFSNKNNDKLVGVYSKLISNKRLAYLIPHLISSNKLHSFKDSINLKASSPYINILGDTYFGEAYTRVREKKGIIDSLQKFDYIYSFEKIKHIFRSEDINICNFEAVFNDDGISKLREYKGYILDANSENTMSCLKKLNFNNLVLANNHAKDFGEKSLVDMLEKLKSEGLNYIGAGKDQSEANLFYEITYNNKKIAIFNGYWHRDIAYEVFDFYAIGNNAGVSSLEGTILNKINKYKKENLDTKVIVISHWGVDFKPIQKYQKLTAQLIVEAGADLIIGHGPHTIQPIEYINGKPIIYSIGNGVFNSNGEFEQHEAPPFGAIVRLDLETENLRLYPIYTNNLKTFWQPCMVNVTQAIDTLKVLQPQFSQIDKDLNVDDNGYYVEIGF